MNVAVRLFSFSAFNSLGKVALSSLMAFIAFSKLESKESVDFFQWILLQSAIIAFLSSSSFFRGLSFDQGDLRRVRTFFFNYLFFVVASSFSGFFVVYHFGLGLLGCLMIIGSASLSLVGALSGGLVRNNGTRNAYLPQIISSALSVVLISLTFFVLFQDFDGPSLLAGLFIAQVISAIIFFLWNSVWINNICHFYFSFLDSSKIIDIIVVGIGGCVLLFIFFVLRERWVDTVNEEYASKILFWLRLSDLILQFFSLFVGVFFNSVCSFVSRYKSYFICWVIFLVVLFFASFIYGRSFFDSVLLGYDLSVLFLQAFLDLFRYSSILFFVWVISQARSWVSFFGMVGPAIVVGLVFYDVDFKFASDLYFFYGLAAVSQIILSSFCILLIETKGVFYVRK